MSDPGSCMGGGSTIRAFEDMGNFLTWGVAEVAFGVILVFSVEELRSNTNAASGKLHLPAAEA